VLPVCGKLLAYVSRPASICFWISLLADVTVVMVAFTVARNATRTP